MSAISKILQINWSVFDLGPAFQDVDVTVTSETGVMVEQDDSKLQVFTGDYGKDNCDKLVDLVTKWSTDYTNILSTAIHGGRDISSLPIITITFRFTDNDATVNGKGLLVQKFTPLLNTLLQDNFETTTTAIPQVGCRYHDFSSLQVAATTSAALPQTVSNALASIAAYRSRIKAIPRFKPTKAQIRAASSDDSPSTQTILSYIPPKSLIPPISISVDAVSRIIDADGDDEIHEVIQTIVSSIAKIGAETSERSLIAHMVASGLVSVGQRMWDAYLERMDEYANNQDDKIDSATLVQYLVTAAGGISAIAPLAQNISKALNAFFLRPQE